MLLRREGLILCTASEQHGRYKAESKHRTGRTANAESGHSALDFTGCQYSPAADASSAFELVVTVLLLAASLIAPLKLSNTSGARSCTWSSQPGVWEALPVQPRGLAAAA